MLKADIEIKKCLKVMTSMIFDSLRNLETCHYSGHKPILENRVKPCFFQHEGQDKGL